mmetsp:Transcript_59954/g.169020  ORF Transcript_59954/g.169020 Transcript_59954/m.169020 type:complete len:229 (-) Transcript_59954:231-917(-)
MQTRTGLSASSASMMMPGLSRSAPSRSSLCMETGTERKYLQPTLEPSVICLKATAKMYVMEKRSKSVYTTDFMAVQIPLSRISSSGIKRSSLAIRSMRERRSRRSNRSMDGSPNAFPSMAPVASIQMLITHVSTIIKATRIESKMNHRSRSADWTHSKAPKRTVHSVEKYRQKKCSATWNTGCARRTTSAVLKSTSMAIQSALKVITASVQCSKRGAFATSWQKPVFL